MRLYVLVDGTEPAIIVGYAPGPKGQPLAILVGSGPTLFHAPLADCHLPRIPKRLRRRMHANGKRLLAAAREALVAGEQVQ